MAAFDLFEELLKVLHAKKSDFFCLPEVHFQLKRSSTAEKYGRTPLQRAIEFLKGTKPITQTDRDEQIILQAAKAVYLNRVERIDGGEQLLFIATKFLNASTVVTHDKKALRALANDAECKPICERMKGRVLCFEQLVLRMIDEYGYKHIQAKIAPRCEIDDAMRQSFSNGKFEFPEVECRKWLDDYVARIKAAAPGLLM